jgi:hypothetical protein
MSAAGENWYVYYPAPSSAEAQSQLRQIQRELAAVKGVRARIEERIGSATPTWMEVYENVCEPDAFAGTMAAAVLRLPPELAAARRVERFRLI